MLTPPLGPYDISPHRLNGDQTALENNRVVAEVAGIVVNTQDTVTLLLSYCNLGSAAE